MNFYLTALKDVISEIATCENDMDFCLPEAQYLQGFNDCAKLVRRFYIEKLEEELQLLKEGR